MSIKEYDRMILVRSEHAMRCWRFLFGILITAVLLAVLATQVLAQKRSVVVLGVDGMDPKLLQKFVDEGRMPNFERLMKEGSFSPLQTSIPPQSPVA